MPLNARNSRTFHRHLYAGQMQRITLLKRDDDQRQGTVRAITLFDCRKSQITKQGQTIKGDLSSSYQTVWHIPRVELDRAGVHYLNALDRIVEDDGPSKGRTWQPESSTEIVVKLFEQVVNLTCLGLKANADFER